MILFLFFFFNVFSLFIIFLIPSRFKNVLFYFSIFSLFTQILIFVYLIITQNLPYYHSVSWIKFFNINFSFYVDNLSALLIILNLILYIISFVFSIDEIKDKIKEFLIWSFLLEIVVNGIFLSRDLFLFYIFFGFLPVPLFFIIKESKNEKIEHIAHKFLFYLFISSSFFITGVLILVFYFKNFKGFFSFDIFELSKIHLPENYQRIVFFLFILPFIMNIFIFPFYKWLYEIITNSLTFCTIIFTGVILKIWSYGIIRIILEFFHDFADRVSDLIIIFFLFNIIYISLNIWREKDFKKSLAYLNLLHIGFINIGIFTFYKEGLFGSILQIFNHGLVSSILFILLSLMYKKGVLEIEVTINRTHFFSFIFIIGILSMIFLPGLSSFPGIFLILYSIFKKSLLFFVISILNVVSVSFYFLLFLIKSLFRKYEEKKIEDLSLNEVIFLIPLFFLILYSGLYPELILWK